MGYGSNVGAFAAGEGAEDGVKACGVIGRRFWGPGVGGRKAVRLMGVAGDVGGKDWMVLLTCPVVWTSFWRFAWMYSSSPFPSVSLLCCKSFENLRRRLD